MIDFKFLMWECIGQLYITSAIFHPLDANFWSNYLTYSSTKTPYPSSSFVDCRIGKVSTCHSESSEVMRILECEKLVSIANSIRCWHGQLCEFCLIFHLSTFLIWVGMFCWLHICKIVETRQWYLCLVIYSWTIELLVRFLSKH